MNENLSDDKIVLAKLALSLVDLTSLTNEETEQDIIELCQLAKSSSGNTAAICIYPQFIPIAKKQLSLQSSAEIPIATVVNFPHGNSPIVEVLDEIQQAISLGANEIDVVFPYRDLINGNELSGSELINTCKKACGTDALLKVIIESGELQSETLIKKASTIAIEAGADFIKTSTGKVKTNATLSAAKVMLETIKQLNSKVGFKAAGGVKTFEDAVEYLLLAENTLGKDWINSTHFRFGASGLLSHLKAVIENKPLSKTNSAY